MKNQISRTRFSKICLSLWQCALLASILIFVITAVLTTCAVLGKIHSEEIDKLLERDLADEQEKREYDFDTKKEILTPNEVKLHLSEHFVLMMVWIMSICTYIGCINLATSIMLVYGVSTRKAIYVLPWILVSGVSYLLIISGILVAYLEMLPGITLSFNMLTISLTILTIFVKLWYIILIYYTHLTSTRCSTHYPRLTTTVIQAYGGYTHTISPTATTKEKKEII
ncbi:uncharacterized protein LOC108741874 [Agrilus planipennis]|uniref:Uncharacterized protein LOC108741874 n=1 Tax=Agrilus planipennis TaxID=224129 RepID=A0A1W4XHS7_AGRPL|nr:uncharacterized protein LOC108741874 [Agrilus planipennis]